MGCTVSGENCCNLEDKSGVLKGKWSEAAAQELQGVVDKTFTTDRAVGLKGLRFSFTIADPLLAHCPLIGCSAGFKDLVGYTLDEIVGRNCRFLIDPVPNHLVDQKMRRHVKAFCQEVANFRSYVIPDEEREAWMPEGRTQDEMFCVQTNARKDGTLFNNMFYLKVLNAGDEIGNEKPFIVGLQTELPHGKADLITLVKNLEQLDLNMDDVEAALTKFLYIQTGMRRQRHRWDEVDQN
mmetsp:Transcript_8397/g.19768  ORF Transcript_8397/g.19768 Transcript_8397/m.19768 type:complete len:238 (+) Transcript_8397:84-797(+)